MIFLSFRPSVIFSKGGFVSLPIVFWAKVFKTKYYIHESDIEIGFANKFAAGSAEKVFTGFPSHFYQSYPWKDKVLFVGQLIEKSEASDYDFGFQDKKPVILVTGGSQGSKVINDTVFGALKEILKSYNLIHQTGTRSYEEAVRVKNSLTLSEKSSYFIQSFLDQKIMEKAISVASLIVTRCGLNTLAEIAVAKKPIIMIPYKHSSSDHQVKNAQEINRITGFPIIKDDDLAPEKLMEKIREMAKNDARIQKMISKYSEIFPENGLKIVAEELMKEEL
jgi:UDP-N-acetylglucosamine--N-acetylmuramyl-(pentapeptide) pyrophosphoryl-undecaprenol N-acetylglucosamine transferase